MSETFTPIATYRDLAGKTAIISGASRGIGSGIARVLGAQGMKLVLAARPDDGLFTFVEQLTAEGVECAGVEADLATAEGAEAVFDEAIERFARVDLLVNNASGKGSRSILKLDEDMYHTSFERNMRMTYGLTYPVSRHMAEVGGGSIINISSVGGIRAHRNSAGYNAVKGAINALTRSMAVDLAPYGVRVNSIAPGVTDTVSGERRDDPRWIEHLKELETRIPLGRLGSIEEMGSAVAFLASEASAYITGQILCVDGGIVAQLSPPGIRL